ncbi:hypothetical protein [Streptomyces canus]|uniref:hypothetical protein n=1 Tax=Streptomyces canus TaxID=58343 RepID=UPI00386AFD43|nr:hypothetical protein OH824_14255 [Streptomyces canus]
MTETTAGQPVTLLAQFYDFAGGTLTDLDTTPTITVTSVATGATALAATSSGVTHPATGSYGYAWTPASSLTPGLYLALWTGLSSGSPVTATETITVTAPASAEDANTSTDGIWYATREDVMRALDVKATARNTRQIDRALESASRSIDGLCHRKFAPMQATRSFDWPNSQYRPAWRIYLDDSQLISLTSATSGGESVDTANVLLEPIRTGPPFSRIEVNLGSNTAWTSSDTHQRAVTLTGLWGYRNTETSVGAVAEALDDSEPAVSVNAAASSELGVGSVLRVDSERMLVTGRSMADTGQNVGGSGLTAQANSVTLTVTDGTQFAIDETLLIDSERMLIVDIAGNSLTVQRAWDGSVLAAHSVGVDIYAARALTVRRGALGTTAAVHGDASSIMRWDPPGLVHDLTVGEAINRILQEQAGYGRTSKASSSSKSSAVETLSLDSLREQVYNAHGRKARMRSV